MAGFLEGARLVLTRPRAQSVQLAGRLAASGAEVLHFPALELTPADTKPPRGKFDLVLFVSPAAVRYGFARVAGRLPARVAAPGQGTAARLVEAGATRVLVPGSGTGIGALLDTGVLGPLSGHRVLLVCGRPVNRGTVAQLRLQGATVSMFCAYERRWVRNAEPLAGWLLHGRADAIMASSVAAVRALTALPGMNWSGVDWIVSSRRVADAVRKAEGKVGAVAEGAGDVELVSAAVMWWRERQDPPGRNVDGA